MFIAAVNDDYEVADAYRLLSELSLKETVASNTALHSELSERQRAEAQLEHLLSQIGAILESTTDGMLALDQDGRIVRFNQRFVEMWNIPDDIMAFWEHQQVVDYVLQQLRDPGNLVAKLAHLQRHPEAESNDILDCLDGSIFELYSLPQTIGVDCVGRILSFRDITAKRRADEALLKEKEEQQVLIRQLAQSQNQLLQSEKMAAIGQLAAGVAHEINNPIGYVYSNLGTLEKYVQGVFGMLDSYEQAEGAITDEQVRTRLQAARKKLDVDFLKEDLRALMAESKEGITRVKQIVQNLKDFSHVDAADEWHFADLHAGIDSTLNIVNNEIKYKATVIKEYGEIPEVECLSSQLNQVFMNLLINAAHAIEERGTITVRSGRQGEKVWVEISDTGAGIAAAHIQKIFDPFFTTKPIGKGTGLGLSLSYGIIEKHHGRIEVKSEIGKGTIFRITLPVRQPTAAP